MIVMPLKKQRTYSKVLPMQNGYATSIAQIEATETTCHKLSKEWDWDALTMVEIAPYYTPKISSDRLQHKERHHNT